MQFDPIYDVRAFHEKFGQSYYGKPRALKPDLANFRINFIREEVSEYENHSNSLHSLLAQPRLGSPITQEDITHHLAEILDALVDITYVTLGAALIHGFLEKEIFQRAWAKVHLANMSKVRVTDSSQSPRKSRFDIIKPPGWTAPDHKELVANHLHRDLSE